MLHNSPKEQQITAISENFYGTESGLVLRRMGEDGLSTLYIDLIPVLSLEAQTAVIGVVELSLSRVAVSCPLHVVIVTEGVVQSVFGIKMSSEVMGLAETAVVTVRTYEGKVTVYELEDGIEEVYEDDFEPEDLAVQIPRSSEITVVMKFEPSPTSLLSFLPPPSTTKRPKKPSIKNLPVTFHKKVKSSGYGASNKPASRKLSGSRAGTVVESVPNQPDPVNTWTGGSLYNSAVFQVAFSPDGTRLGVCGSEATSFLVKLPVVRYKGERTPLIGHEQSISGLSWSSGSSMVLTTSLDRSTKLWSAVGNNPGQCLLSMPYSSLCSQFYYKDRFLALTDVEKVRLFTYKLTDPSEKDDVKRLQSRCKYKEKGVISHPSAQTITRFTGHNLFHSHLLFLCGSNKTISIWDLDSMREIRQISDPHRKSIHCIRLFKPALAMSSPNYEAGNVFLTGASDSEVHIWDIRQRDMVMTLLGHVNTAQEINGEFSPVGTVVAYGSEDRAVYLWDLRTGNVLDRIRGFRDVVSTADFSPTGGLSVGSYDSSISFYSGS